MKTVNAKGKKNSKKQKKWPYVLGALLVAGAIGSVMDGDDSEANTAPPEDNTSISSSAPTDSTSMLEDEIEIDAPASSIGAPISNAENTEATSQSPADPEPQEQPPEETSIQDTPEPEPQSEPQPPETTETTPPEPSEQMDPPVSSQPSETQDTQSRTVYVTPTGKRYHYDGNCNGGTYIESTLEQALARGLTPCKKCAGG